VSVDREPEIAKMIERIEMTDGRAADGITFLSDPDHRVIDRYGLLNPANERRPLPHPTVYLIDRDGRVHWKFTEVNYKIRPTNEMVHAALEDLLQAAGPKP